MAKNKIITEVNKKTPYGLRGYEGGDGADDAEGYDDDIGCDDDF